MIYCKDFIVSLIWDVLDFLEFGVIFKDIILLLVNFNGYVVVIFEFVDIVFCDVDVVFGMEVCGFMFVGLVVFFFGVGFVFVCKFGKFFGDVYF